MFNFSLIHYKPTHVNFNVQGKCWAMTSGALGIQIKHMYLFLCKIPFTWKIGEGKVTDYLLLKQGKRSLVMKCDGWDIWAGPWGSVRVHGPAGSRCQTIPVCQEPNNSFRLVPFTFLKWGKVNPTFFIFLHGKLERDPNKRCCGREGVSKELAWKAQHPGFIPGSATFQQAALSWCLNILYME